jgi:hypothetical protein
MVFSFRLLHENLSEVTPGLITTIENVFVHLLQLLEKISVFHLQVY